MNPQKSGPRGDPCRKCGFGPFAKQLTSKNHQEYCTGDGKSAICPSCLLMKKMIALTTSARDTAFDNAWKCSQCCTKNKYPHMCKVEGCGYLHIEGCGYKLKTENEWSAHISKHKTERVKCKECELLFFEKFLEPHCQLIHIKLTPRRPNTKTTPCKYYSVEPVVYSEASGRLFIVRSQRWLVNSVVLVYQTSPSVKKIVTFKSQIKSNNILELVNQSW